MKTYIYFVRHAISPFSLDNERARGLSEQGKIDSIRAAELLEDEEIDIVVSSTFARAVETVKPLADLLNKEIIQYEELVERPIASLKYKIDEEQLLMGISVILDIVSNQCVNEAVDRDRLIRSILLLSDGDIEKFFDLLYTTSFNFRDIVYRAEHDQNNNKIRDFSRPFVD